MIAITGGGTGGHLSIAKALKEEFYRRGIPVIFIGSYHGQDKEWFDNDQEFEATYFLSSEGVVNKKGLAKIKAIIHFLKGAWQCYNLFKKHNIHGVVSVGGYSAAPATLASIVSGRLLVIHEQNAVSGLLNRLSRPFSSLFFSSFEKNSPCHDYPVRTIFFDQARPRTQLKTVLFLGGSQGALAINQLALDVAPYLHSRGIHICHQTGHREYERVAKAYQEKGIPADCFPFSKVLIDKIVQCDLAVCRAGAGTVFELGANQLPAIFIPYPFAAGNHQYHNALFSEHYGNAKILLQSDISVERFIDLVETFTFPFTYNAFVKPQGAACIVDHILRKVLS